MLDAKQTEGSEGGDAQEAGFTDVTEIVTGTESEVEDDITCATSMKTTAAAEVIIEVFPLRRAEDEEGEVYFELENKDVE